MIVVMKGRMSCVMELEEPKRTDQEIILGL